MLLDSKFLILDIMPFLEVLTPENIILILLCLFLLAFAIWQRITLLASVADRNRTLLASRRIYKTILEDLNFDSVVQKIADTIPNELQFGTGVVSILDEQTKKIRRIGASKTAEAQQAIHALNELKIPFDKIEIDLSDPTNLMARSLREHGSFVTSDVYDVLGPVLTREECKKIQLIMGTKTTLVYPIFLKDKPLGVFIASTKKDYVELSSYELFIIDDFVNLVGLVLQNSKLFTSLKQTKEDLARVNSKVQEANEKLKELDRLKDDFVSVASHELRTPMTAIRSYVWMAIHRSDIPLSEKLKKYLYRTLVSTERLINLVNDMLNISRIESGRIEILPKPFDIRELVDDVLAEVNYKAQEKQLKLNVFNTPIPKVFADPDKVHQILLNLIGNALKFTPLQGSITVSFFSDGNMIDVLIKDTGVGIDREDINKLFKKFGRLENSYVMAAASGGTGLGLYISRSLIEIMGGRIKAYSEGLGKGATFTFSLPIASERIVAQSAAFTRHVDGEAKYLEPPAI